MTTKTETPSALSAFLRGKIEQLNQDISGAESPMKEESPVFKDVSDDTLRQKFQEERKRLRLNEFLAEVKSALPSLTAIRGETKKGESCIIARDKDGLKPPTAYQEWTMHTRLPNGELSNSFVGITLRVTNTTTFLDLSIGTKRLSEEEFLGAKKDGNVLGPLVWDAYRASIKK